MNLRLLFHGIMAQRKNINIMKIEDLEVFISAVESETFFTESGAPHRFQTSAAGGILALENEFGTKLFLREGQNSGILTDAGKRLLKEARPLVKQYRRTMRAMDRFRAKDEQKIIIGALPIMKQYRLNRVFMRYMEDYPEVDLAIEETDGANLIAGLREDYYDAIIVRKSMIQELDVDTYRMASDEMAAILPEGHPLAHETTIQLEKLKNEEFYLTNPYTPAYGLCWKLLKDRHISTENVHTANIETILPVISEKKGVAILPMSNVSISRQKGIVAVPLSPRTMLEVVFAVKQNQEFSTQMKTLIEIIEKRSKAVPQ